MHHYVYVDSKNRNGTHGNSYTLSLTSPIKDIIQVDLVSAKVPNSLYNITDGTSIITINGLSYSIPPGFYSAQGLASTLASITSYGFDYLCNEGKFIMYSPNSFTVVLETDEIARALGSLEGASSSTTRPDYSGQQVIISDDIIDLSTNEYIFLDIEELRSVTMIDSKTIDGNTFSGSTISTVFAMIPLDVSSGQIKTFKEKSDYKIQSKFANPIGSISKLTIRWLDKNGKLLNFNGFENNSFVLRVHTKDHEPPPPPPPPEKLVYVPLPAPPQQKSGSKRWILYLVLLALAGGFGFYLYVK